MSTLSRKRRTKAQRQDAPTSPLQPHTEALTAHHDVEAPSRETAVWRVRTRLDGLLADGRISAAEWMAGDSYRRDYEVGELGGRLAESGMPGGGGGSGCPTQSRLDALKRLREARAILGVQQVLAVNAVALDTSWPTLGLALGCGRTKATQVAMDALGLLADHYGYRGTGGKVRAVEMAA